MTAVRGAIYRGDQRRLLAALIGALVIHVALLLFAQLTGDRMPPPRRFEDVMIELVRARPATEALPTPVESVDRVLPDPTPTEPPAAPFPEASPAPIVPSATASPDRALPDPTPTEPPAAPSPEASPAPIAPSATASPDRTLPRTDQTDRAPTARGTAGSEGDPRATARAAALERLGRPPAGAASRHPDTVPAAVSDTAGALPLEGDGAPVDTTVSTASVPASGASTAVDTVLSPLVAAALSAQTPAAATDGSGSAATEPSAVLEVAPGVQTLRVGGGTLDWEDPAGGREDVSTPPPRILESRVRGGCKLTVRFMVDAHGLVSSAEAVEGSVDPNVDIAVENAVKRWTFNPSPGAAPAVGRVTFVCE